MGPNNDEILPHPALWRRREYQIGQERYYKMIAEVEFKRANKSLYVPEDKSVLRVLAEDYVNFRMPILRRMVDEYDKYLPPYEVFSPRLSLDEILERLRQYWDDNNTITTNGDCTTWTRKIDEDVTLIIHFTKGQYLFMDVYYEVTF
jgi:hypothetical protein